MHTTSAVSAADMSHSALLVEMMTADDVVGEDALPAAAQRQTAAAAAAGWGLCATGRSASWDVRQHPSGAGPILMAQENPAGLWQSCGASRADAACTWRRIDREAWR